MSNETPNEHAIQMATWMAVQKDKAMNDAIAHVLGTDNFTDDEVRPRCFLRDEGDIEVFYMDKKRMVEIGKSLEVVNIPLPNGKRRVGWSIHIKKLYEDESGTDQEA